MINFQKKRLLPMIALMAVISCKPKETQLLSTKDGLVGSWKLKMQGEDVNKNGKFDTEEKNQVSDSVQYSYQFMKDGKGYRVGNNSSFIDSLTWELVNNDASIAIKLWNKGFKYNQTYDFETGTKTLILKDKTLSPTYFYYFDREN